MNTTKTEQKASHTPGPWEIHNNIGRKSELGVVADGAPCIVAVMGNTKEWPVEAQANARLIAAAPELLEACKQAEAELDLATRNGARGLPGSVTRSRYEHAEKCRQMLIAVIAKVEGRS